METEKKNKNRNERSILLNRLSSLASWHPFMRSTGAHKTSCTLTGARFGLGHASSVKQSPHLGWIVTPRLKKFQEATQTKATMTTHRLKPRCVELISPRLIPWADTHTSWGGCVPARTCASDQSHRIETASGCPRWASRTRTAIG